MKTKLLFLSVLNYTLISFSLSAQKVPAANAVLLSDTLHFVSASTGNQTSVVFHPVFQKYYSLRAGSSTFPLETWSVTGLPLAQTNQGIDSRGVWYNPNTGLVERNCFSSLGWATVNLDVTGNTLNTFNTIFTGQLQPDVQSVGAYDYKTNTVLFNNSGLISVYNRTTGVLNGTLTLTGTSLANINIYSMIYTGETGFEIGLLDNVAKRVLLFNRATGVFSGVSQLPATAVTHNQFRFSYANDRVWLFNATTRTWNSFNIWQQALPVELISFSAITVNNNHVKCEWTTASEMNNDYYTVERSKDGVSFEEAGLVPGAGNSSILRRYSLIDQIPFTGISYYRLKQTDLDGKFSYSPIIAVQLNSERFLVFPTVVNESFHIAIKGDEFRSEAYLLSISSSDGKQILQQQINVSNQEELIIQRNQNFKGMCFYTICNQHGEQIAQGKLFFQ